MKGTYILIIFIPEDIKILVGSLGTVAFKKGYYFYVGSAMGVSGAATLINRVKRHLLPPEKKKTHWHIDYLLQKTSLLIRIYLIPSSQRLECIFAQELLNISDDFIENFGSSDCNCKSHLLYFKNLINQYWI